MFILLSFFASSLFYFPSISPCLRHVHSFPTRRSSDLVGGLLGGELLAEHGHDLLTENVELLQHGLERQARVVHEEELALVVAEHLPETERAVDDLLRAADGQRGLAGELLQGGPAAVYRRVVEIGAKL